MKPKRYNVLVSAYACNPSSSARLHPGEDIKGWRFVGQISRFHKVWVIAHRYNREGVEQAQKNGALPGVNFVFVALPGFMRLFYKIELTVRIYYYLWQIRAWWEARKLHNQVHFDVIHHISFGNDWMPSYMGALMPVPFIWGPLGGGQRTPSPLLKEYTLYGRFAEKVREAGQFFGRHDYFRRQCLKKARAILVCNKETWNKIPHKYGDKLFWYPLNGIFADDILKASECHKKHSRFRVVTAGRLHRLKGFPLSIRCFAQFSSKHPNTEFVIIGRGPEQARLQELIQEFGIQDRVHILSWMSREDLLKTFGGSDVFLFTSFRDGGGAVVVEAMAAGLPIICLDVGGPGFHVRPEWGIKVPPRDSDSVVRSLANALESLYTDRALRQKMGKAALNRAKDYYLSDKLGEQLNEIYHSVLP